MVSLAALRRSWGVEPSAVIGHSQGEIAAACVAGALSLQDGARVVALRSRALAGDGGMVSVMLPEERVRELLPQELSVAAVNGPAAVVVSGPAAALDRLLGRCEERARRIAVGYASHSPQMNRLAGRLLADLAPVTPRPAGIALISTLTGEPADGTGLGAEYWADNLRRTVRFQDAVRYAAAAGHRAFLEVSPHPVLLPAIGETLDGVTVAGSLRRDDGGLARMLTSAAELFAHGTDLNWDTLFQAVPRQHLDLPTYAFQRQRYWLRAGRGAGDMPGAGLGVAGHPLLGAAVMLGGGGRVWTGRWSVESLPWLADHAVGGSVLVAGAVWAELALFAGEQAGVPLVRELVMLEPLVLAGDAGVQVQVQAGEADRSGTADLKIYSRPDDDPDAEWTQHAAGILAAGDAAGEGLGGVWPPAEAAEVSLEGLYERLAGQGYEYGPVFRGLRRAWRDGGDLLAEVELDEAAGQQAGRYGLHPALLDAALHAVLAAGGSAGGQGQVMLPFAWQGVSLAAAGAARLRVRIRPGADGISVLLADGEGLPVAQVRSLVSRPVAAEQLRPAGFVESLYALEWVPVPGPVPDGGDLVVFEPAVAGCAAGDVVAGGLAAVQRHLAGGEGVLLVVASQEEPGGAALWGLVRSAQSEHPGRFVLADCDGDPGSRVLLPGLAALGEPQLLIRAGAVSARRLARTRPEPGAGDGPWRLERPAQGGLDGLTLAGCPEVAEPLGPGQVRLDVRAAGLNFRDVLNALGMYPGDAGLLGAEAAGVVTEVGPQVRELAVGDRVMGIVPGGFGPVAVINEKVVAKVPTGWSWSQAASVPRS